MTAVDKWNKRYLGSELVWSKTAHAEFVIQVADLVPGRALDLGSGEGRNAIWLAQQGWHVSAVDFAEAGINKARQLASEKDADKIEVNWIVSDVCEYHDEAGFDLVAIMYLHTSQSERDHWLPRAIKMVRPGGVFLYIGHDPKNIIHGVGGPQEPELLPDVTEFEQYLSDFDIVSAGIVRRNKGAEIGHGMEYSGNNKTAVALDCIVKAIRR